MTFSVNDIPDQSGMVVLVTGGNAGIGKETCKALLEKGAKVYLAARSQSKAEEAIKDLKDETMKDDIHFLPLDLSDLESVKNAANIFLSQETQLHQLYNNAGIMATAYETTKDGHEGQFGTNVVGHFALTKLLLPVLEETAKNTQPGTVRVINVSSDAHKMSNMVNGGIDFDDIHLKNYHWFVEYKRYAQSKLGNILLTNEIKRRYEEKGIYSITVHPGPVKTNLMANTSGYKNSFFMKFMGDLASKLFFYTAPQGATTSLYAGTSPEIVDKRLNGAYLVPFAKVSEPNAHGKDAVLGIKLWDYLEKEVAPKGI